MKENLINITINNRDFLVSPTTSIFKACETFQIEIPRFCYHESLAVSGNCRMCLVEVEKSPKPVVSCAMPVSKGMVIFTETPLVKKAREAVLEFLLINHPLDCPICDQGGECDLQDITLGFASDRGRYYEFKRGVKDKECGPIVKTIMTRCIHCTRCIRFSADIAGTETLGAFTRGESTEIGTYISSVIRTELSGNLVDLCPVGALTSKPVAYLSRNWELDKVDTIDFFDSVCSDISVQTRSMKSVNLTAMKNKTSTSLKGYGEIVRILPRSNGLIADNWISDKTRFAFDGVKKAELRKLRGSLKNKNVFGSFLDISAAILILFKAWSLCFRAWSPSVNINLSLNLEETSTVDLDAKVKINFVKLEEKLNPSYSNYFLKSSAYKRANKLSQKTSFKMYKNNLGLGYFKRHFSNTQTSDLNTFMSPKFVLRTPRSAAILESMVELDSLYVLSYFFKVLGSNDIYYTNNSLKLNLNLPNFFSLNRTLNSLDTLQSLVLIGVHPRFETPLLNVALRKEQLSRSLPYYTFSPSLDYKLKVSQQGNGFKSLVGLVVNRTHFASKLYNAKSSSILLGAESAKGKNGFILQNIVRFLSRKLYVKTALNERAGVIHSNITTLNLSGLGLQPGVRSDFHLDALFDKNIRNLAVVQPFKTSSAKWFSKKEQTTVINFATNKPANLRSDLSLPLATLYETSGFTFNVEGRLRKFYSALARPVAVNSLKDYLLSFLFLTLNTKERSLVFSGLAFFWRECGWNFSLKTNYLYKWILYNFKENGANILLGFFAPHAEDFYITDLISENSTTMALAGLFNQNLEYEYLKQISQ